MTYPGTNISSIQTVMTLDVSLTFCSVCVFHKGVVLLLGPWYPLPTSTFVSVSHLPWLAGWLDGYSWQADGPQS